MSKQGNPVVAKWLVASGILALGIGVLIGVLIEPIYGLAGIVPAVVDFVLAMMFGRGAFGKSYTQAEAESAEGTPREPDYSENPYARED
jgi:hypothetical protein